VPAHAPTRHSRRTGRIAARDLARRSKANSSTGRSSDIKRPEKLICYVGTRPESGMPGWLRNSHAEILTASPAVPPGGSYSLVLSRARYPALDLRRHRAGGWNANPRGSNYASRRDGRGEAAKALGHQWSHGDFGTGIRCRTGSPRLFVGSGGCWPGEVD
jgi:hypothetical protein